jgi:hypothetical protein
MEAIIGELYGESSSSAVVVVVLLHLHFFFSPLGVAMAVFGLLLTFAASDELLCL